MRQGNGQFSLQASSPSSIRLSYSSFDPIGRLLAESIRCRCPSSSHVPRGYCFVPSVPLVAALSRTVSRLKNTVAFREVQGCLLSCCVHAKVLARHGSGTAEGVHSSVQGRAGGPDLQRKGHHQHSLPARRRVEGTSCPEYRCPLGEALAHRKRLCKGWSCCCFFCGSSATNPWPRAAVRPSPSAARAVSSGQHREERQATVHIAVCPKPS